MARDEENMGIGASAQAPDILNAYTEAVEDERSQAQPSGTARIALEPEQERARSEGYAQSSLGVVRTRGGFSMPADPKVSSDGTPNATAPTVWGEGPSDATASDLDTSALYRRTLGATAHSSLKRAVGIADGDSFTDWYEANGGNVPAGFEVDARLCLAEERRMRLQADYEAGLMSESDFLYKAYGKDLLKENGYYLDSSLWWYNRHENGDFTNPLDSDSFVTSLLQNARTVWQAETWFAGAQTKALGDTLSGYVTGNWLSADSFYQAFRSQVDALKPYFQDSVEKVLQYYKAGNLGSAFVPFIDSDGDGKYDYYFHTDGRMYAVEGSSGVGSSKCSLTYNDDGSVHAVQIRDGFDGPIDSFMEGFRDFFVGFLDIGSFVVSAVVGIADAANGGNWFVDSQARWEAFKKSTWALGDKDYVTFDGGNPFNGEWTSDDWANNIANGVGTVAGMVVLAALTAGIGNSLQGAKRAADVGKNAATEALKGLGKDATQETVSQAISAGAQNAVNALGEGASKKVQAQVMNAFIKQAQAELISKNLSTQAVSGLAKTWGKSAAAGAIKSKAASIFLRLTEAGQKARSGFVISTKGIAGGVWGRSAQIAATSAVKDFIQVGSSLEAKNAALQYLEDATDGQVKALSKEEIWGRAAGVAAFDLAISTVFRATGPTGLTSRFGRSASNKAMVAQEVFSKMAPATQEAIRAINKHMVRDMVIDNAADIFENVSTAAFQAAMSNPYAKAFGSEWWNTAFETALSPSTVITNLYVGFQNMVSYGKNQRNLMDQRLSNAMTSVQLDAEKIRNAIPNLISSLQDDNESGKDITGTVEALRSVQRSIDEKLSEKTVSDAGFLDKTVEAARMLDDLLTDVDDAKKMAAFGLDADGLAKAKQAMKLLQTGNPTFGIATGVFLNDAKENNLHDVIDVYSKVLSLAHERATERQNGWQSIWKGLGRIPGLNIVAARKMAADFGTFLNAIGKGQFDNMAANSDKYFMRSFITKRLSTLEDDPGKVKELTDQLKSGDFIKFSTFSDDSVLADLQIVVKQNDEGGFDVRYVDKDSQEDLSADQIKELKERNPLLALFSDYKANSEEIAKLSNVFRQCGADNVYEVIAGKIPWFCINMDPSKRNDALQDKNVMAFVKALEIVSMIFEDDSGFDGFPLADYEVDLLTKVEVPYQNSDGTMTKRTVYVIANPKDASLSELSNRIQVAQSMIYGVAKVAKMVNDPSTSADAIAKELVKFGLLMDQDETFNGATDFEAAWKDAKQKGELTKKYMLRSATALLRAANFGQSDSKPGEFGRRQLIRLYRDNVLNDELLADCAKAGGPVAKNVEALRQYVDMDERIREADSTLFVAGQSDHKISMAEYDRIQKLTTELNDPKNEGLLKALKEDNRLPNRIKEAMDHPERFLNFGRGLSEGSANRLTREGSSAENDDAIAKKAVHEIFLSVANEAIAKTREAEGVFKVFESAEKETAGQFHKSDEERALALQSNLIKGFEDESPNKNTPSKSFNEGLPGYDFSELKAMIAFDIGTADGARMYQYDGKLRLSLPDKTKVDLVDYLSEVKGKYNGFRIFERDPEFAESVVERQYKAVSKYRAYLTEGTEIADSEDCIYMDLDELVPQALRSAVIAMEQSEAARHKLSRAAKLSEDELRREAERIIGGGAATSQLIEWMKLRNEFDFVDGPLRFSLKDDEQMRSFREIMQRLGYDNDVQRILSGQESIEGIGLYDRERHVIRVENVSKIRDAMSSRTGTKYVQTEKSKDVGHQLRYALASAQRLQDDTSITLPEVLLGTSKNVGDEGLSFDSYDGKTYKERNSKANLEASEAAKRTALFYNAIGENSSNIDERSRNTCNLIKAVCAVFEYAKENREYQSNSAIPYSDDLWNAINMFYKDHSNSIVKPEKIGNTIVFSYQGVSANPDDFDKQIDAYLKHATTEGFDIREIIPIWTADQYAAASRDFAMNETASAETAVSTLLQRRIPGFDSLKDMASKTEVDKGEFYVYDRESYSALRERIHDYGSLKGLLDNEDFAKKAGDHYLENLLRYQIQCMVGMSDYIENEENGIPEQILKFADAKANRILVDMLGDSEYARIVDGTADDGLKQKFANEYNSKYKSDAYAQTDSFDDSFDLYDDEFTSASLSLYSPKNVTGWEIEVNDVSALSELVSSFSSHYIPSGDYGVPLHNSIRSALSFVRFHDDGTMDISMEDYINATKSDRKAFREFLDVSVLGNIEGFDFDEATVGSLRKLSKTLAQKDEAISDMRADKDVASDRKVSVKYESPTPNAPSIEVTSKYAFVTGRDGRGKNAERGLLAELSANRQFSKKAEDKFVRSSTLASGNRLLPDDENAIMEKLLDQTSYQANDKTGSIMVHNIKSAEGIGEMVMQAESFVTMVRQSLRAAGKNDLVDSPDFARALADACIRLGLYTSGSTFAAEYAGAMLLQYDPKTKEYEIKPITVSVSNPDDSVYEALLYADGTNVDIASIVKANKDGKRTFMFRAEKNAFVNNASALSTNLDVFDMDDPKVRGSILEDAFYKATKGLEPLRNRYVGQLKTPEDVLNAYYGQRVMLKDIRNNIRRVCKEKLGLDDSLIDRILPTVSNMSVMQPTKFKDQKVGDFAKAFIDSVRDRLPNNQVAVLEDALFSGVTLSQLNLDDRISLENCDSKIQKDYFDDYVSVYSKGLDVDDDGYFEELSAIKRSASEKLSLLNDIVDEYLNQSTTDHAKATIRNLPEDDKIYVIKKVMSKRRRGQDIAAILKASNGETLRKYFDGVMKTLVGDGDKIPWDSDETSNPNKLSFSDIYSKKTVWFDSEWLYKEKDPNARMLYQWAFIIRDPDGTKHKHNIFVKNTFDDAKPEEWDIREGIEAFKAKSAMVGSIGDRDENGTTIHVVQSTKDAMELFSQICNSNDVEVRVAYNNKADGSDDSWLIEDDPNLKGIANLDLREDGINRIQVQGLDDVNVESLDALKELGIIQKREGAHDALVDIESLFDLYDYIKNNKSDVSSGYTKLRSEISDIAGLEGKDLNDLLGKISFKNLTLTEGLKEAISGIDSLKRGNNPVKELLSAVATSYEYVSKRESSKALRAEMDTVLHPVFGSREREAYVSTLKNPRKRIALSSVFMAVFKAKGGDFNDVAANGGQALRAAYDVFSNAFDRFKLDRGNDIYGFLSNSRLYERFLSLPIEQIKSYIVDFDKTLDGRLDLAPGDPTTFSDEQFSKIPEAVDFLSSYEDEVRTNAYNHILNPVANVLFGEQDPTDNYERKVMGDKALFGDDGVISEQMKDWLFDSLVRCYGSSSETKERLKNRERRSKLGRNRLISDGFRQDIVDFLKDEMFDRTLSSHLAAWKMAQERREFVRDGGDFGVLYIGADVLRKMDGFRFKENGERYVAGDTFYSTMWRQPGQQATVIHLMKVVVTDKPNEFTMTRATAKTYFNGDFDGDFFYLTPPDAETESYGEKMFDKLTVGGNVFNTMFDASGKGNRKWATDYFGRSKTAQEVFDGIDDVLCQRISDLDESAIDEFNDMMIQRFGDENKAKPFLINTHSYTKGPNIITSSMPFLNEYLTKGGPQKQRLANMLLIGNQQYVRNNILDDGYIDTVYGVMSKVVKGKLKSSEHLGDLSYVATLAIPEESQAFLIDECDKISKDKATNIINSFTSGLRFSDIGKDEQDALIDAVKATLSSAKPGNGEEVAYRLITIAKSAQTLELMSDGFKSSLDEASKPLLSKKTQELAEKVGGAIEMLRKVGYQDIADLTDEDKASGPRLLMRISEAFEKVNDKDTIRNAIRFSDKDGGVASKLFSSFLTKANIEARSKNGIEVIASNARDSAISNQGSKFKGVGLADDVYVAVRDDDVSTDTAQLVHEGASKLEIDNMVNINSKNLTSQSKASVLRLARESRKHSLSGRELAGALGRDVDSINEKAEYRVFVIDRNGTQFNPSQHNPAKWLDRDFVCVISEKSNLYDTGLTKVALTGTKNMKVTLSRNVVDKEKWISFGKVNKGGGYVSLIVNKSKLDYKNQNASSSKFEFIENKVGSDGKNYAIVKVNNMALVSLLDQNASYTSFRDLDPISIICGSKGAEAMLSFGELFYSFDNKNGFTYDPEGYRTLRSNIAAPDANRLEDVNGANVVRTMRIATYLSAMSDKDKKRFINLANKSMRTRIYNVQAILMEIAKRGDAGGDFGRNLEAAASRYVSMDKEAEARFQGMKENEDNPFVRTLFSEEMQDLLSEDKEITAEDDGTPLPGKKDKLRGNIKTVSMSKTVSDIDSILETEDAKLDTNGTTFVPMKAVLRMLLERSKLGDGEVGLIVSTLKSMFETGLVSPIVLEHGSRLNNYHPIPEAQAKTIMKRAMDEKESWAPVKQNKKSGASVHVQDQAKMTEDVSALVLPRASQFIETDRPLIDADNRDAITYLRLREFSPFDRASEDADKNVVNSHRIEFNRNRFGNLSNTRLTAALTDGSDEKIVDAFNGYRGSYDIEGSTPYPTLDPITGKMVLKTRVHGNVVTETAAAAKEEIADETRSPKLERIRQSKLLDMQKSLSMEELEKLEPNLSLDLLEGRLASSKYEEANAYIDGLIEKYKDEKPMGDPQFVDIFKEDLSDSTKEDILKTVSICANSNGMDLVGSAWRSWGFKAENNADIPLGSRIINMNAAAGRYTEQLLGREFSLLGMVGKANPDKLLQLEQTMKMQYALDAYDELTSNRQTHLRQLGQREYDARVSEAIQALGGDPEAMRQRITQSMSADATLSTMFNAVRNITMRIMDLSRKRNPYTIVGWYVAPSEASGRSLFAKFGEYTNVYRFSREPSVNRMLEEGFGSKSKGMASALYNDQTGIVGNLLRVATELGKAQALDDLGDYMRSNGFMTNDKAYAISQDVFEQTVLKEFESGLSESFGMGSAAKSDSFANDSYTYGVLQYAALNAGVDAKSRYEGPEDFVDLYVRLRSAWADASKGMGFSEYVDKWQSADGETKDQYNIGMDIYNAYMATVSTMVAMLSERGGRQSADSFLRNVYTKTKSEAGSEFVIVDKNGAIIDPDSLDGKKRSVPVYSEFDLNDVIREYKFGGNMSREQMEAEVGKMIVSGNAYLMRKSVAEQLDKKIFTSKTHGVVHQAIKKAKSLITSLIMSSPVQLMDRLVNFPIYDMGVTGTADWHTMGESPIATATVMKLVALGDNLKQEDIDADPNLAYLIRFLAASHQDLRNSDSVRGERVATSNIPLVKQYIKLANLGFNIGNTIPRFAYYLNLVKNAEANGYSIDPTRMGVAFHMQDGISKITGNAVDEVYSRYGENAQRAADLDAQAVQIIAEHNGFEGNMPYLARSLAENYNAMFISFPMAMVRWGINRVQSLGYAFMTMAESANSRKYLLNQVGSVAITSALLLALQLMLSSQTREWLRKKASGDEDEITEEEKEAAENIMFRGGCVKVFESLREGTEVTTTAHNRGPASALFDSYLADFVPATNGGNNPDFSTFWYSLMKHTWGHVPFVVKDPVESIPGNKVFQTTSWAEPSDNFLENYGRKVCGYVLGSQQANAVFDYYNSADHSTDQNFMEKLANGMKYAYVKKFANTKESKAEWKNYRKAFSLLYEYKKALKHLDASDYDQSDNSAYASLKSDLLAAIKTQNNVDSILNVIQRHHENGTSLSTIRSALKNCSLKQQMLSLGNYQSFMDSLSDSNRSLVKAALIYEDQALPFIDDAWQDFYSQYREAQRQNGGLNAYPTIKEAIYNRSRNVQRNYGFGNYPNSNYGKLKSAYPSSKSKTTSPTDAYRNMVNAGKYGNGGYR